MTFEHDAKIKKFKIKEEEICRSSPTLTVLFSKAKSPHRIQ